MTLDADDVEAIARRVAELLGGHRGGDALIDAQEAARRLGVERSWVYAHARELGGVRLGEGPRARLRFDPDVIRARVERYRPEATPAGQEAAAPRGSQRPRRRGAAREVQLIRGRASGRRVDGAA